MDNGNGSEDGSDVEDTLDGQKAIPGGSFGTPTLVCSRHLFRLKRLRRWVNSCGMQGLEESDCVISRGRVPKVLTYGWQGTVDVLRPQLIRSRPPDLLLL